MSDCPKKPRPAGLPEMELRSPPRAVCALPSPLNRAVAPCSGCEKRRTSCRYCPCAVTQSVPNSSPDNAIFLIYIFMVGVDYSLKRPTKRISGINPFRKRIQLAFVFTIQTGYQRPLLPLLLLPLLLP